VVELAVANPLHPGLNLRAREPRDVMLNRVLATLPADVSVATQEEAYTHLALRDPYATLLPQRPARPIDSCFVLIDRDYAHSPRLEEYGGELGRLVAQGAYVSVESSDGIDLYRSTRPCQ
jgi:hypothetical protein